MILLWTLSVSVVHAETLRVATFASPLSRDGPGLLLRDLLRDDPQIAATLEVIAEVRPDVLLLTNFDFDAGGAAAEVMIERLAAVGVPLPYALSAEPNSGVATGLDLDGNGYLGDARDAQGYGRFAGDGGVLVLSRYPLTLDQDYSALLWRDLPESLSDDPPDIAAIQRFSSTGHWVVQVAAPEPLLLTAFAATPPVYDGPEDRNGRRNADEIAFWQHWLNGTFGTVTLPFVIAGNANLDPDAGEGRHGAIASLLADPRLQDPLPSAPTAHWEEDNGGDLRVSYLLPSAEWTVYGAGVFDPAPTELLREEALVAGPHRLVWLELGDEFPLQHVLE